MNRVETFWEGEHRSGVPRLFPLTMLAVVAASLLQWMVPIDILSDVDFVEDIDWRWPAAVGSVLAVGGLVLSYGGHLALARRGADVKTPQSAEALVVDGAFQWTRNPVCLGMLIALAGLATAVSLDWLLILIVPLWLFVDRALVRPEEVYLERRFGRAYQVYARRAPRYLFVH